MELSLTSASFSLYHHRTSTSTSILPSSYCPQRSFSPPLLSTRLFRHGSVCTRAVEVRKADQQQFPPSGVRVVESEEINSTVKLNVEVSPKVCASCRRYTLDEFSKRLKVNGFRPSDRLPEKLIENYVGREAIQKALIESILRKTLPQAMSSLEGRALQDSVKITNTFEELNNSFSESDVFKYEVLVDVAPAVKWLLDSKYKDLKIVVEIDDTIGSQKASENELKRRHKSLGILRIVSDRGLEIGDLVVLDIYGESIAEGETKSEKIPTAERKGFHLDTEEAGNTLLPGFLDSIVGIRPGESRSFDIQFPQTWEHEILRGVNAKFTVDCKELFYRELPELDDSIAGKLLPGCSTLDQVKEVILQRCKEIEQNAIEQATDNAILDRLGKIVEAEVPQSLLEEQGRQLYGAKLLQLQAERRLDESQLETLTSEKSVREYLDREKENISTIVRQMLAIGDIFKCENLQFSTDELVKEVENSVSELKKHNQEYEEDRVKQQVQDVLEGAKVLEWLKENAQIEYIKR